MAACRQQEVHLCGLRIFVLGPGSAHEGLIGRFGVLLMKLTVCTLQIELISSAFKEATVVTVTVQLLPKGGEVQLASGAESTVRH